MTSHVFIVDDSTLKVHLEHLFAGIGSREDSFQLIQHPPAISRTARRVAGMASDISRVASGDSVFFYLQQSRDSPGRFYGEFVAVGVPYGVAKGKMVAGAKLSKNLPLRVAIAPKTVFPRGVREDDFLDRLSDPRSGALLKPHTVPWTLIYRKLLGNRGCVAIRDQEADLLRLHLKATENNTPLESGSYTLNSEDSERRLSRVSPDSPIEPAGDSLDDRLEINLRPLYDLAKSNGNQRELFLQWLLIKGFLSGDGTLSSVTGNRELLWLGNEVRCGVGNRAIDLLIETAGDAPTSRHLYLIELKDDSPRDRHQRQVEKYIHWAIDHYLADETYERLVPILITTKNSTSIRSRPAWKPGQLGPFRRGEADYSAKVAPLLHFVVNDSDPGRIELAST